MEIMEDGNLMDRVRILLQRDLAYYQDHQTVLQENLCPGVVGGLLDFPHYASFAAVKLILWWEEAYVAAYRCRSGLLKSDVVGAEDIEDEDERGCGGVATTSSPQEFQSVVTSSASQMLEHLHTLSQEALDHADLTVLTGTLGAASVIKNCLWCYNEKLKKRDEGTASAKQENGATLHDSYRRFHDISEALAERLMDLHCRLLSLYVLQDADCLNWEDTHPFFEGERGSFVIQMWWLYMQGTKESLWNTVPPKTAQRVLAGMLNESLTILTVRYIQAKPSSERSLLLITDISNLLLCVRHILPSICCDADELLGHCSKNKVLRDIHMKCYELLKCLIFRGCPLSILYRVFRKGFSGLSIFECRDPLSPAPWFIVTSPHLFTTHNSKNHILKESASIALELCVLVAQPQALWPLLLKVLLMCNGKIASVLMNSLAELDEKHELQIKDDKRGKTEETTKAEGCENNSDTDCCKGFLCSGKGECSLGSVTEDSLSTDLMLESLVYIIIMSGGPTDFRNIVLPVLEKNVNIWGGCLDERQVWNQSRPPWLAAFLKSMETIMSPVVHTVTAAVEGGASVDQATVLALDCLEQVLECIPPNVICAAVQLEDVIPADVHPIGGSVPLQLLVSVLYSQLLQQHGTSLALGEALCDVGQNTKHSERIRIIADNLKDIKNDAEEFALAENTPYMPEVLASNLLLTAQGTRALKVMWQVTQHSSQWLLHQLGMLEPCDPVPSCFPHIPLTASRPPPASLLHTMFHVGHRPFDQLLTGDWKLNWSELLQIPLNVIPDSLWAQISCRPEFHESPNYLSQHDAAVITALKAIFQQL